MAGVAGKFVEFPFDTVKVRLQTQPLDHPIFKGPYDCFRQTVRNEGFLGLYNVRIPPQKNGSLRLVSWPFFFLNCVAEPQN